MRKGITLLEIIVTLSIIAIIFAITFPIYSNYMKTAKRNTVISISEEVIEILNISYLNDEKVTVNYIENKLLSKEVKVKSVNNDEKSKTINAEFYIGGDSYLLSFSFKESRWKIYDDKKEVVGFS